MKTRLKLRRTIAEFVVVVVGVMVALAGDNWREAWQDSRLESTYFDRLRLEVERGLDAQATQRTRVEAAQSAILSLVERLDASGGQVLVGDSVVDRFLVAARLGFQRNQFGPDVTYRELVTSGQLHLIQDPLTREAIVEYYNNLDQVQAQASRVVPLQTQVARLTGHLPFEFIGGNAFLSEEDRQRLLELLQSGDFLPDLREAHSDLNLLYMFMGFLDEAAASLLGRLGRAG